MYFSMLAKVRRPSITPSSSTIRLFSSRMISAASRAISTAPSTEMPISAARKAGASLIPSPTMATLPFSFNFRIKASFPSGKTPSPIKPTTCPSRFSNVTMRSLCIGVRRANSVVRCARFASSSSDSVSISLPMTTSPASSPTSWHTFAATNSLSPVRIFTVIPLAFNAFSAGAVVSFGGSRKAIYPSRIRSDSSARW